MCDEVLDTGARLGMWWQPGARVLIKSKGSQYVHTQPLLRFELGALLLCRSVLLCHVYARVGCVVFRYLPVNIYYLRSVKD